MAGLGQSAISGVVVRTTDAAILFRNADTGDELWVPRSVCLDGAQASEGDTDLLVADWWLRKEGWL